VRDDSRPQPPARQRGPRENGGTRSEDGYPVGKLVELPGKLEELHIDIERATGSVEVKDVKVWPCG
jgi:hypothetical protein